MEEYQKLTQAIARSLVPLLYQHDPKLDEIELDD